MTNYPAYGPSTPVPYPSQGAAYGPQPWGPGAGTRPAFGVVGATLAAFGGVLLIVAFTAVSWFDGDGKSHFGDVRDGLNGVDKVGAANGIAHAFFGWLGWALLAAAVLVAVLANVPGPASTALRVVGALIGAAGMAVTFLAIKLVDNDKLPAVARSSVPQGYGEYLKHTSVGFYLALAGFLLAAVGALIGPRRS